MLRFTGIGQPHISTCVTGLDRHLHQVNPAVREYTALCIFRALIERGNINTTTPLDVIQPSGLLARQLTGRPVAEEEGVG